MQIPLQITGRNAELDEPTRALIRRHAAKLETFSDRITGCRVVVEVPQRFPAGPPITYNVRVDLTVPGDEIVVGRQENAELETAIQDAFDAAGRRLQDYVRTQEPQARAGRAVTATGWVVRLFPYEGYGFVATPDQREIYFHRNSVRRGAFESLEVGTAVRFTEEQGDKGPQASTVTVVAKRARRTPGR